MSGRLLGRTMAGKYVLEAHVGSGAMGNVYRGRHVVLGTSVALKILRQDLGDDPSFRERFYREAKAASLLSHPSSVRVLDFGEEPDGLLYLAMEYLDGRDLATLARAEWPLDDARIVDILSQVLGAVAAAHERGIVHRDLKPENIMVLEDTDDDGRARDRVKVCDFGIAKLSDPRAFQSEASRKALTTSGALVGTPEYMSPEQARGDPLDARSDLYSLGVVLYQLLAGRVPFTGENALGIVLKQVTDEAERPSSIRPGVNPVLEEVCLRALRKKPDDRFANARDMRAALRRASDAPPRPSTSREGVPSTPDLAVAPTALLPMASLASMPSMASLASMADDDAADQRSPVLWIAAVAAISLGIGAAVVVAVRPSPSAPIDVPVRKAATTTIQAPSSVVVAPVAPPESPRRLATTSGAPTPFLPPQADAGSPWLVAHEDAAAADPLPLPPASDADAASSVRPEAVDAAP